MVEKIGKIYFSRSSLSCNDNPPIYWISWEKKRYMRHRDDGPAAIWSEGYKEWWVYGTYIKCNNI